MKILGTVEKIEYKGIKERFSILLCLVLFFPTVLNALGGDTESLSTSNMVIQWNTGIAFLLTAYLIIEIFHKHITTFGLSVFNVMIFLNIGFFIPLLLTTVYAERMQQVVAENLLGISLGGVLVIPFGMLLLFLFINKPFLRIFGKLGTVE